MHESDFDKIMNEIQILGCCESEFIIKFYGIYFEKQSICVIMEILEIDLSKMIPKIEEDDWKLRYYISLNIVRGLKYLHCSNPQVLHLDLKPANVLLSKDFKQVKLVDFGLSTTISNSNTFITNPGGTFNFMAPEQVIDKKANSKSDIYSFGCLFYNLCSYDPPWRDFNMLNICTKFINRETPSINEDYIPVYFREVMKLCLKFDQNERPSVETLEEMMMNIGELHSELI